MTATRELRGAITGLLGLAVTEELVLLQTAPAGESGSPERWAAVPVIAHNAEFKEQQVQRLAAVGLGEAPPDFAEIDHGSAETYGRYSALPADEAAVRSRRVTGDLIGCLGAVGDEDLLDSSRHPWLRGRQLWLQIVVRGFWHPIGHLGEYYLAHARPDRAVALAEHAAATAAYLGAPGPARGMASYNLACALARADRPDLAAAALRDAVRLNPDVQVNARRDPDLAVLRDSGLLEDALVTD